MITGKKKTVEKVAFMAPAGLCAWYKEMAEIAGVSVSAAYRAALSLYLRNYKERPDPRENQLLMDVETEKLGLAMLEASADKENFNTVLKAIETTNYFKDKRDK